MAQTLPKQIYALFILLIFASLLQVQSHQFARKLSSKSLGLKKEKLSHLHFYFQDILSGNNRTSYRVAEATVTNTSSTGFGATFVVDDLLTVGPEITSKIVGRAQGIYAFDSLSEFRMLMAFNFVFVEGKYNGSTLSLLGTNEMLAPQREMPIVGGSGLFRFARGYAIAKTNYLNLTSADAVVEYNVYVIHY